MKGYRTVIFAVIFALVGALPELLDWLGYDAALVPDAVRSLVIVVTPIVMGWLRSVTTTPIFSGD